MVGRGKLLDDRSFGKGYVVFVGGNNLIGIFLRGLFNHLEERRLLFHTVDDERSAEDFVAAVFRVDLREAEYFGIGQPAAEVFFHFLKVVHFFFGEGQAFFFVVCFQVFDVYDGFRPAVCGKYVLVETFVHALQHRVVVCVLVFHGKVFLNAGYAVQAHVLSDFYGICAPRGNHFRDAGLRNVLSGCLHFRGRLLQKPAEFVAVCLIEVAVALCGNHALGRGSEKRIMLYLRFYELRSYRRSHFFKHPLRFVWQR